MSIGNKGVYPFRTSYLKTGPSAGLTYREWLIGMLASNGMFIDNQNGIGENLVTNYDDNASAIIQQADAIIKELNKQ